MRLKFLILVLTLFPTVMAQSSVTDEPPFVFKNWGLRTGSKHKMGGGISMPDAWKLSKGNRKIVVAVVDTGIDSESADLRGNLWHDPVSPKTYGWNFVTDKPNPIDDNGHGTHVAGIIAGKTDNDNGMTGIAPKVRLMPIKYYSDSAPGSVNLRNTVSAIEYAVQHNADIINYSGGGPEFAETEYLAIKKAEAKGILVVAAAGNEHENNDLSENYYYPGAYRATNVIVVASTDFNNEMLPSSNWGQKMVDVTAPGENIFSTLPGGRFGYMTGTSQATAFVSGIAALILSERPCLKPIQVKAIILKTVDKFPQLNRKVASGGRVNAYKALRFTRDMYTKTCKPIGN